MVSKLFSVNKKWPNSPMWTPTREMPKKQGGDPDVRPTMLSVIVMTLDSEKETGAQDDPHSSEAQC